MEKGGNLLKIYFSEVLKGYSEVKLSNSPRIFVKHLNFIDSAEIDNRAEEFKEEAHGLPTLIEREEFIKTEGLWGDEQEKEVKDLNYFLNGLNLTRTKLHLSAEIKENKRLTEETQLKLLFLQSRKESLIGLTQESYSIKKANEYYMFQCLYKDKELTERLYSNEQFEELDEDEIKILINLYNTISDRFSPETLKKIAVSPFFLNIFYLCNDDAYHFYNIPISRLSFYQVELFNQGKFFKHIFSESRGKIDDSLMNDPDALIDWFNANKNAEKLLEKAGDKTGGTTMIVGATKEDMRNYGVTSLEQPLDLAAEARKKGGKLGIMDIMRLQGEDTR